MKAYSLDLRQRVVDFVNTGGTVPSAVQRFKIGRATVYRYLDAAKADQLAPKTTWGHWRKLDPKRLAKAVRRQPDATLRELQTHFPVSLNALSVRLRQLGITLKKKSFDTGKGTRC